MKRKPVSTQNIILSIVCTAFLVFMLIGLISVELHGSKAIASAGLLVFTLIVDLVIFYAGYRGFRQTSGWYKINAGFLTVLAAASFLCHIFVWLFSDFSIFLKTGWLSIVSCIILGVPLGVNAYILAKKSEWPPARTLTKWGWVGLAISIGLLIITIFLSVMAALTYGPEFMKDTAFMQTTTGGSIIILLSGLFLMLFVVSALTILGTYVYRLVRYLRT
jgi:hypothetical protein